MFFSVCRCHSFPQVQNWVTNSVLNILREQYLLITIRWRQWSTLLEKWDGVMCLLYTRNQITALRYILYNNWCDLTKRSLVTNLNKHRNSTNHKSTNVTRKCANLNTSVERLEISMNSKLQFKRLVFYSIAFCAIQFSILLCNFTWCAYMHISIYVYKHDNIRWRRILLGTCRYLHG